MPLIKNIKSFLMKESYDFDRPDPTLHNFHPQLQVCFAMNGVFYNNRKSKLRFILPVLNILLGLVVSTMESMFVWRGLITKDYAFATESFCYIVILGMIPIVYTSFLINSKKIIHLIENMNNDFNYISELGSLYQRPFLKGQLLIWSVCWTWLVFIVSIGVLFASNTIVLLMYQSLLAKQNEYMVRPLIFPMWLPKDDPYRTPNYEIFMVLQIVITTVTVINIGGYVYTQLHIFLHYYVIINLINLELLSLFDGMADRPLPPKNGSIYNTIKNNFRIKIKRIVTWHNSVFDAMDTVSSVYGPARVYQVLLSSILICLMMFQVADQLENGKLDYLFSYLLFGTCVQLWIPCYMGTMMRNKAFSIGDACFNCGWETTPISLLVRSDLTIIMVRSQRPLAVQFAGLPNMTLETYASELSTKSGILCLKQTVQYYTDRKTPIFARFLDLPKAFNLVAHDALWEKLASETDTPEDLVAILKYWYGNQVNQIINTSYSYFNMLRQSTKQNK